MSLRDPVDRMMSAYKNKIADKTVRKHLDENLYQGKVEKLFTEGVRSGNVH